MYLIRWCCYSFFYKFYYRNQTKMPATYFKNKDKIDCMTIARKPFIKK